MNSVKKHNFIKSWGLLFVALLVSGAAFWLAVSYLTAKEGSLREEILSEKKQKVRVIVASRDLMPGDVINLDSMALAFVDNANLSTFAIGPEDFSVIEGSIIQYPMSSGEPLLSHAVVGEGIERFSDLLEYGERAITLEIDSLNSASNMLVAGDFVDLMFLMEANETSSGDENKSLRPLLQNVRVLAVDAFSLRSKKQDFVITEDDQGILQYSNITVGVHYEDASKLVLARDIGDIVFMLRNKEDEKLHDNETITHLDLNGTSSQESSYQFYSPRSGGSILPQLIRIIEPAKLKPNKTMFSMPIKSVDKVSNIDANKNNKQDAEKK